MKKVSFLLLVLVWISCYGSSQSVAGLTPEDFNLKFFELYKEKGSDAALDFIFSSNKWLQASENQTVKTNLKALVPQIGKYIDSELITKKSMGKSFVLYSFLVKFERQPLRFNLTYYKPQSEWMIISLLYDNDLQQQLIEAASAYRLYENIIDEDKMDDNKK